MSTRNTGQAKQVRFKLDPDKPVSAAQRKRLADLAAMPDEKIDYSDIPPLPGDVQWSRPGALVPSENKQQVTLRLDADVLGFFKSTGKRYQSRINAALREYMNAHRKIG
jgi:uncharacterized protein (DUF4415 family)